MGGMTTARGGRGVVSDTVYRLHGEVLWVVIDLEVGVCTRSKVRELGRVYTRGAGWERVESGGR